MNNWLHASWIYKVKDSIEYIEILVLKKDSE